MQDQIVFADNHARRHQGKAVCAARKTLKPKRAVTCRKCAAKPMPTLSRGTLDEFRLETRDVMVTGRSRTRHCEPSGLSGLQESGSCMTVRITVFPGCQRLPFQRVASFAKFNRLRLATRDIDAIDGHKHGLGVRVERDQFVAPVRVFGDQAMRRVDVK